jgi:hypothetical protein
MKVRPAVLAMALTAIASAAVCVGTARAQNSFTPNESAAGAAQAMPPGPRAGQAPALPYGAAEVMRMYQGGINKDVIVNYINSTSLPYHLNADSIIYLQTLGMPQEITKSMILRDGQLQQQQAANQQYYQQQPMPGPAPSPYAGYGPYGAMQVQQPPAQVVMPSTPAPAVTTVVPDYSYYDYGYPYYYNGWPYYYGGPSVYVGGWGWGWGWGGWGRGWGYGGYRGGYGGYRGGYGGGYHGGGGFHGGSFGGHGGGGHGGGGHR